MPPRPATPISAELAVLPTAHRATVLALLPFENLTGDPTLDWIELGLSALVARELTIDARLAVVSMESLLTALAGLPKNAGLGKKVDVATHLLGAHCVAHVRAYQEQDNFILDCSVGVLPLTKCDRLVGPDLVPLAHQLALTIEAALFPNSAVATIPFESDDPLASLAFARALQAIGEQNWKVALPLLEAILDIEPDNRIVESEYLSALALLGHDTAFPLGERLLEQARAEGDAQQEIHVHLCLGRAFLAKRLFASARQHLDEGMRLISSGTALEPLVLPHLIMSAIALHEYDLAGAAEHVQRVRELCEQTGNQILRLSGMTNAAFLSSLDGNLTRAAQLAREARDLSSKYNLRSNLSRSTSGLAVYCGEQGLFGEAIKYGREVFASTLTLSEQDLIPAVVETLSWLCRELRRVRESSSVIATLDKFERARSVTALPGAMMARGHNAACSKDHEAAIRYWQSAIALCRELNAMLAEHLSLPWLVVSLVLSRRDEEAQSTLAEVRASPRFDESDRLRAALLHCQALQLHGAGQPARALEILREATDVAPIGLWRANACIDGAWLCLEADDIPGARKLMRDLGPWLDEHPAGIVLAARLKYAQGAFRAAADLQRAYAAAIQNEVPEYYAELSRIYESVARGLPTTPTLPLSPWLPTRM
ncbi:MAG: hypothetical protein ABSF50_18340 [Burkholderiaceae bacterium]